MDLKAIDATLH